MKIKQNQQSQQRPTQNNKSKFKPNTIKSNQLRLIQTNQHTFKSWKSNNNTLQSTTTLKTKHVLTTTTTYHNQQTSTTIN